MKLKNFILLLVVSFLASCGEKDWDDVPGYFRNPNDLPYGYPFGNNTIIEDNVISIADLKNKYSSVISSSQSALIEDDIKIKAVVSANDSESGLSNAVALQDETGGILVSISDNGICGYLPVAAEILVDLKGLYIGGYGEMPQIGAPYNNTIGRMNKYVWQDHFRILSDPEEGRVVPKIINSESEITDEYLGTLITLKNVSFHGADGKTVFAPDQGSSYVERYLNEYPTNYVIRTSAYYAKYANDIMPEGKVDLTVVLTRYRDTWQFLIPTRASIKLLED